MISTTSSLSTVLGAFGTILNEINGVLSNAYFLFYLEVISFTFKICLLGFFTKTLLTKKKIPLPWVYLILVFVGSVLEDASWIASLMRTTYIPNIDYRIVLTFVRIGWAAYVLMYQSLSLFIESFLEKTNKLSKHQYLFLGISVTLIAYYITSAFIYFNDTSSLLYDPITEYASFYILFVLSMYSVAYVLVRLKRVDIPRIVKSQLMVFLKYLIIPTFTVNIIQMIHRTILTHMTGDASHGNLAIVACSTIFFTLALFYCLKKIIGLRFLNIHSHVHSSDGFNFTNDFKTILKSLGESSNITEVKLLTQRFFKQAFNVPSGNTIVSIQETYGEFNKNHSRMFHEQKSVVERFIENNKDNNEMKKKGLNFLKKNQILIYDEIKYDNFHEPSELNSFLISFLDEIQADIFMPIYEQDSIIAYVIIERNARAKILYSDAERDEIIVFATYLSNTINLLQNRSLKELLKQRKDVMEDLYSKHQQINQYKEAVRSFLHNNNNAIGLMFHKNRKFSFGNEQAQNLIGVNPNTQEGHPTTKALKEIVKNITLYKTTQTAFAQDTNGRKIVFTGMAHGEHHSIIIMIHYPEISDIIQKQLTTIKDPSDWDYLLYLETTKSGKLINELIPGTGELLLNFKINLLKTALSKKALLLDMADDDLNPTVELLHHISLREILYTLDLQSGVKNNNIAIKLFGINPLFGDTKEQPLLEKLNKKGTLFIKNIHLLDLETQDSLAQFIRYGLYNVYKSNKKIQSDVRIICSTSKDLNLLVQENKFSHLLFNELSITSLTMPRLLTLSESELDNLVEGFTQQAVASPEFDNLLVLTDKERDRLATQRPVSLMELKQRVQNILINKSKKNNVFHETHFDPAYSVSDPELVEAARLGKYALKDRKLLEMLWNKFQSQNKIALFLGVNRSSVNRRCKEYNLS